MKATVIGASTLFSLALCATLAPAFTNTTVQVCSPVFFTPNPVAPDACGPGFYATCPSGMVYGPNYWLRPSTPPFTMPLPTYGPMAIPANPYVRGPRDFFMWRENMEDQMYRNKRPALVP